MRSSALGKKNILRTAAAIVVIPLLVISSTYAAEEKERKYDNIKTKQRQAVGAKCGKILEKVQEFTEEEAWVKAQNSLQSTTKACGSSYEKSQVFNFLGYVYYAQDRYIDAIRYYKKMINEADADERQAVNTRYTIAQLYLIMEDYASAARELEEWMKVSPIVGSDAKVLLGQAYYQLKRKNDALRLVEEAISEQEAKGNLPKEGWWSLQRVIYYEKNDYRRVVSILEKLIKNYPSFSYWRQLGGMYGEIDQELNQLVSNEVTYLAGTMDKERQLLSMAYMFLGADAPFMAARLLEKAMKEGKVERNADNLELLGLSWQQGQNSKRALPVLEEAAKASGKGIIYARLAGVYLDLDQNAKSVVAARNAIKRGGVKRIDLTYMNMGNAQISLYCYNDAIKAFRKAAKHKKSAKYARQWINYAEKEGDRRKQLIESGAKISGCKRA